MTEEVAARVYEVRAHPKGNFNCLSAVLYLLGDTSEEIYLCPQSEYVQRVFSVLSALPASGEIVVPLNAVSLGLWRSDLHCYYHFAFLLYGEDQVQVVERPGWNKALSPPFALKTFRSYYQEFLGSLYQIHFLSYQRLRTPEAR